MDIFPFFGAVVCKANEATSQLRKKRHNSNSFFQKRALIFVRCSSFYPMKILCQTATTEGSDFYKGDLLYVKLMGFFLSRAIDNTTLFPNE